MEYVVEYSSHSVLGGDGEIEITAYVKEKKTGHFCAHFSKKVNRPSWLSRFFLKKSLSSRILDAKSDLDKTVKAFVEAKSKEIIMLGEANKILATGKITDTVVLK